MGLFGALFELSSSASFRLIMAKCVRCNAEFLELALSMVPVKEYPWLKSAMETFDVKDSLNSGSSGRSLNLPRTTMVPLEVSIILALDEICLLVPDTSIILHLFGFHHLVFKMRCEFGAVVAHPSSG